MTQETLLCKFFRVMHYSVENAVKHTFIQDTDFVRNFCKKYRITL